jgi:hypothetical protein
MSLSEMQNLRHVATHNPQDTWAGEAASRFAPEVIDVYSEIGFRGVG